MYHLHNMITVIRNGYRSGYDSVNWSLSNNINSKKIYIILSLLRKEGSIRAFVYNEGSITIYLKYGIIGMGAIKNIFLVSKPSCNKSISCLAFWQPQSNVGYFVLSTNKGIITDSDARRFNVGGQILFGVV